jgi:rhodanese-related sulfurtransferase
LVGAGVVLLDVREPSEWAEGHAPDATHQPLGQLDPARFAPAPAVYVICRSGNRSATATRALAAAGVDAYNVDGGMIAWTAAHLPVSHA